MLIGTIRNALLIIIFLIVHTIKTKLSLSLQFCIFIVYLHLQTLGYIVVFFFPKTNTCNGLEVVIWHFRQYSAGVSSHFLISPRVYLPIE